MSRLTLFVAVIIATCCTAVARAQTTQPSDAWTPLMNGRDFTGWYTFLRGEGRDKDSRHVFQIDDVGVVHLYRDAEDGADMPFG
jgi:hypothetical protein